MQIATPHPHPKSKAELWSLQSSRISIGTKYTAPYKGKTLQSMASCYKQDQACKEGGKYYREWGGKSTNWNQPKINTDDKLVLGWQ